MGGAQSAVKDDNLDSSISLKRTALTFLVSWTENLEKIGKPSPTSLEELQQCLGFRPMGIEAMFALYPDTKDTFFSTTLPFIIESAAKIKDLLGETLEVKKLRQGKSDSLILKRNVVLCLMANMFLCTTAKEKRGDAMPFSSFDSLLQSHATSPQEVAKLRMFVHYFERCAQSPPQGELRIHRQVRQESAVKQQSEAWASSSQPLLEIDMVDMMVGFEDARGHGCLHADFANMFLGGGVLTGGCVQEEIRFAICPELCVALLVCPCMLDNEAITIVGGEQFSSYQGYAYKLEFAGNHTDESKRDDDGTALVAITAMDAFDFRGRESSMKTQMAPNMMLRELEKAAAAFAPVDKEALEQWPVIATGNWGCGVFGGSIQLKAVLQWLAASEGGRRLRYFPFDAPVGPELEDISKAFCKANVTVGQVFAALSTIEPADGTEFLKFLKAKVLARAK
eukprot:CAMPEP_0197661264 /NCGR_PEP_ID=MMETSP1338-20131121/51350_1 /TAXON_ID=43686 ORGANISM="Pelagodinium beii, Strain RCC1491" /NCGR_SAMPLE_ID=MMETSP1338 /ASSEMBLY_ACC=CAM_ASM_000754 /LENGTH=451 /DNA_ID=CAMNT_0043238785 /DNA_START=19 /DNA_END=1374 /DNA_ORIENTATION=-